MPDYINNLSTSNGYTDPLTFPPNIDTSRITFDVGNNPIAMQVWRLVDDGRNFVLDPQEIQFLANSFGMAFDNIAGARFRSLNNNAPAIIYARRLLKADALLSPGTIVPGTVGGSGGFTPPQTGLNFQHNEALVANETALDFVDNAWNTWVVSDDPTNFRVKTSVKPQGGQSGTATTVTVTATTEGTATTIVTAGAFVVDGVTPLQVVFNAPRVEWTPNAAADIGTFVLYDGGASIGWLGRIGGLGVANLQSNPVHLLAILDGAFLPAAGSHTYSVRCFKTLAADTFLVDGGVFGLGALAPISLIVTPTTI